MVQQSNFGERIIEYVLNGNTVMIESLLKLGFISRNDTFVLEGNLYNILELISSRSQPCHNYKKMIDVILDYGPVDMSTNRYSTPLQIAILSGNFPVAAYLQSKGGTYSIEAINAYNVSSGTNLYKGLDMEFAKLTEII